jgi:effector-binding domain-containing protein
LCREPGAGFAPSCLGECAIAARHEPEHRTKWYRKNVGGWERAARLIGGDLMLICGVVALHASPLGLLLSGAGVVTLVCEGTRERKEQNVSIEVTVQIVTPRKLAAVRREVEPAKVGSAWRPAVDKVWDFLRSQPGLWTDGHNIFLYHDPKQAGAPLVCEFGVQVTRGFEISGEVYATETPGGEAAVAVHRGPYNRLDEAYKAIGEWMAANGRQATGHTWEIYGDPTPDPNKTETTVLCLLK